MVIQWKCAIYTAITKLIKYCLLTKYNCRALVESYVEFYIYNGDQSALCLKKGTPHISHLCSLPSPYQDILYY